MNLDYWFEKQTIYKSNVDQIPKFKFDRFFL